MILNLCHFFIGLFGFIGLYFIVSERHLQKKRIIKKKIDIESGAPVIMTMKRTEKSAESLKEKPDDSPTEASISTDSDESWGWYVVEEGGATSTV